MNKSEAANEAFERARKIFENWESHSNLGRVLLLEVLAAAGGTSGHIPADALAAVKQRFVTAI
ncbi:hypothetical protein ACQUE4_13490, partial [Lactococcus lactis]|uniref:hypothetical protein n=1 Tax=Lactococcus lactis TaxID=1358 RepID=UPI003D104378